MALTSLFNRVLILVHGGGDLGSGVIYRLRRAGFAVVATELSVPLCVRRTVSYGSAVFEGAITVDGLTAQLTTDFDDLQTILKAGNLPVVINERHDILALLTPTIVVDARMAKRNLGITVQDAPLVIALGPGLEAGVDCHVVIETNRGHYLGRVITSGSAQPNTGVPGNVGGIAAQRVLRSPMDGVIVPHKAIGDLVREGEVIVEVAGQSIAARFDGVLRGLIHPQVQATKGMKIGDLDPRAQRDHCFTISDKALAIGGGVLEAVLASNVVRHELIK